MFQTKRASQSNNAKVEVEVSLDVFSQLYSIVVTEASNLQSIVSVPSKGGDGHGKADSSSDSAFRETTPGRLADCLRPSSPMPKSRHSALQERGRPRSLPPRMPSSRGDNNNHVRPHTHGTRVIRDLSCPPSYDTTDNHDNPDHRRKTVKQPKKSNSRNSINNHNKPNLVSKTAARRSFFSRPKATRQIIPAL